MKKISELINKTLVIKITGKKDNPVSGITSDSRYSEKNSLFFAIPGIHSDGHSFIPDVITRGACAVVHQKELDVYDENVSYILVKSVRKAMSSIAAAFYDNPSGNISTAGITGTDGKSSTVYFLTQLLELAGVKTGCISTVMVKTDNEYIKNPIRQTTPDAPEINSYLVEMINRNCRAAVIEASSHGLSEKNSRLADIKFSVAVLTHISHEHLEFHGTMENYINDKVNLFRITAANSGTAIINYDEENRDKFITVSGEDKVFYSAGNSKADIYASKIRKQRSGYSFRVNFRDTITSTAINLSGEFNISNCLAAVLAAWKISGISPDKLAELLPGIKPLAGRMFSVDLGQPFIAVIDYAHSPGSFEKQFPVWHKETENRLIAVFGSAGERDPGKRKIQGEIASEFSDIIILTDEDPRGEDSMGILKEIAEGCTSKKQDQNLFLIPDRRKAIRHALKTAESGDLIVFLGKGHESSIIYKNHTMEWDEKAEVEEGLRKLGYGE